MFEEDIQKGMFAKYVW